MPGGRGRWCREGLTFVLQVEAGGGHTDVRLEVQVELVGGAVEQGGHRGPWKEGGHGH